VVWHFQLIRHRQREGCFKAFTANHWLGLTLFVATVLGFSGAEFIA
jgi:4-hydroxybenzoate polyprenyltransferase